MDFIKDIVARMRRLETEYQPYLGLTLDVGICTQVRNDMVKVVSASNAGQYESEWLYRTTLFGVDPTPVMVGSTILYAHNATYGIWLGVISNDLNPTTDGLNLNGDTTTTVSATDKVEISTRNTTLRVDNTGVYINGLRVRTV